MLKSLAFATSLALIATAASADIEVRFIEGAPKDRFDIVNTGGCALGPVTVTIDLAGSSGGLVFDVTAQGAGVQVFQPFELVAGRDLVIGAPQISDGDQQVMLDLSGFGGDQTVSFTIDVDDTGGARETTVSGAEISGARVQVTLDADVSSGMFDESAVARVKIAACIS